MDFLAQLPKNILVFLSLFGGVLFILYADPPVTICRSTKASFIESQKGFLFVHKQASSFKKESLYQRLYKLCKDRKNPGSCYQLFYNAKSLLLNLSMDSIACVPEIPELKIFLEKNIQLILEIAWGPAPPASASLKSSWLKESDFNLFCQLVSTYSKAFGYESKQLLAKKLLAKLPGYAVVNSMKAYKLSLFSIDCRKY